jgi:hypothetical protein
VGLGLVGLLWAAFAPDLASLWHEGARSVGLSYAQPVVMPYLGEAERHGDPTSRSRVQEMASALRGGVVQRRAGAVEWAPALNEAGVPGEIL